MLRPWAPCSTWGQGSWKGEIRKADILMPFHILKIFLFLSKVKSVAASLTWHRHRRRVRCASLTLLRDTALIPVGACSSAALGHGALGARILVQSSNSGAANEVWEVVGGRASCPLPQVGAVLRIITLCYWQCTLGL